MNNENLILRPKNWEQFQHYKDRCPPWVKLHRDLLNNKEFMRLPTASKALAPLFWLLASESSSKDGSFDASDDELEFRLRMSVKEIQVGRKSLIDNGSFIVASTTLASASVTLADAIPEERRGETEGEKKTGVKSPDLPGFADFWETWPSNDRKQAKGKCLDAWKKASAEREAALVLAHVCSLKNGAWMKDGGQYVPSPLVYLNQRRWEGAASTPTSGGILAGAI